MRRFGMAALVAIVGLSLAVVVQATGVDDDSTSQATVENPAAERGDLSAVRRLPEPVTTKQNRAKAPGTITYDTGTAVNFLSAVGSSVGNVFNTAAGVPVLAPGTVTKISYFVLALGTIPAGFVTIYDNPTGGAAPVLSRTTVYPVLATWNTVTVTVPYTGPAFLAGLANGVTTGATTPNGNTCGLDPGTVPPQGFHAMAISVATASGNNFRTYPFNALVRASGNVLVPVELMQFEVE